MCVYVDLSLTYTSHSRNCYGPIHVYVCAFSLAVSRSVSLSVSRAHSPPPLAVCPSFLLPLFPYEQVSPRVALVDRAIYLDEYIVYMRTYVCMHVCMFARMYVCMYVSMYACM